MKRRMAFLLALVMALALAIGVMPASAADTDSTPPQLNLVVGVNTQVWVPQGCKLEVPAKSNGLVQLIQQANASTSGGSYATVRGYQAGNGTLQIVNNGTHAVVQTISVTVTNNNNSYADLGNGGSAAVKLTLTSTSQTDYFVDDTFSVQATVTDKDNNNANNKVSYSWWIVGTGANAELTSSSSNGRANFRITAGSSTSSVPGKIVVHVKVYGANNTSRVHEITINNIYGGTANITYIDSKTNQKLDPDSLQTTAVESNLPRNYTIRSGSSVGYTTGKVVASADPSTLRFSKDQLTLNVVIYVRDATAWDNRPTQPDYGSMGYVVLNQYYANNPYVIMVGIEAMNNLEAMNVGDTQQITADMLGGVPVNAPGMSYKVADESIADVTQDGLVRGKKAGMTMLRVFCGDHEVINKQIFVLGSGTAFEDDPIIDEDGLYFGITSVTRSLEEKGDVRFRVSAKNLSVDGEKIGHDEVEWSSSDTSVARVDDEGYVSIRKVGECYIYGTYTNEDGKEFTSRFKVVVEE